MWFFLYVTITNAIIKTKEMIARAIFANKNFLLSNRSRIANLGKRSSIIKNTKR